MNKKKFLVEIRCKPPVYVPEVRITGLHSFVSAVTCLGILVVMFRAYRIVVEMQLALLAQEYRL